MFTHVECVSSYLIIDNIRNTDTFFFLFLISAFLLFSHFERKIFTPCDHIVWQINCEQKRSGVISFTTDTPHLPHNHAGGDDDD